MAAPNMKDLEKRMQGALEALKHEFTGLRTGRAHISLLDTVMVESYGSSMPINQVGTVSTPESRLLSVQVWDKNNLKAVEKGIRNSGLGLNGRTARRACQGRGQLFRKRQGRHPQCPSSRNG